MQCAGGGKFENFELNFELKLGNITKILITVKWLYYFLSADGESGGNHITSITVQRAFSSTKLHVILFICTGCLLMDFLIIKCVYISCNGGKNLQTILDWIAMSEICNHQRIYIFTVLWTLKNYCDSLLMIFLFCFVGY